MMDVDPGFANILWFAAAVVVGGIIMAAISYFSMKETKFEDVLAKQRQQKVLADKEKMRINKQKREQQKKKSESKKKKAQTENGKISLDPEPMSPAHEVQIKPTEDTVKETQKAKKKVKPKIQQEDVQNKAEVDAVPPKKALPITPPKELVPSVPVKLERETKEQPVPSKDQPKNITAASTDDAATEAKPKKKKTKKQFEEHPIVDAVRSTSLDNETAQALMDVIKQQCGSGDWSSSASGISKEQVSDLQRKLNDKEMDIKQHINELVAKQQKIDHLNKVIDDKKKNDADLANLLEQQQAENAALQKAMQRLQEEDKKQIMYLQKEAQASSEASGNLKNLKDENEILKNTVRENSQAVADKDRLSRELQSTRNQLTESERNRLELEHQLKDFKQSFEQRRVEVEQSYSQRIEEMSQKAQDAQGRYSQLEVDIQNTQNNLERSQTESAKLLDQVAFLTEANDNLSALEKEYGSMADTKQELEERLTAMDANDTQRAEEVAKLHTQTKDLQQQIRELENKNQTLTDEVLLHKTNAAKATESLQKTASDASATETVVNDLKSSNHSLKENVTALESEVEKLKKKNNELRERNWKAMDAVAAAERAARDKVASSQDEQNKALNALESRVRSELCKSFPDVSCAEKEFDTWLPQFLTTASDTLVVVNNDLVEASQSKIDELEKEKSSLNEKAAKLEQRLQALQQSLDSSLQRNKNLEDEVTNSLKRAEEKDAEALKYKNILNSTETILSNLQRNIEEEEESNRRNVASAEDEKKKSNIEINLLRKQIEDAEKSLKEKSEQFDEVTAECARLKQELTEMQEVASVDRSDRSSSPLSVSLLDAEVNTEINLIEDDQGFVVIDKTDQERLEKEKALTKSLGAAANKLQTVLKQTQDQLSKEREKTKDAAKEEQEDSSEVD